MLRFLSRRLAFILSVCILIIFSVSMGVRIGVSSDHDPFRDIGIQALGIAWRDADDTNLDDTLADEVDLAHLAAAGTMTVLTLMMNAR
mgnify:CR=1 FL=1